MAERTACPIQNCNHKSKSSYLLFNHLMRDHKKNDLAAAISVLMDLVDDLQTELKDLKWKFKVHE